MEVSDDESGAPTVPSCLHPPRPASRARARPSRRRKPPSPTSHCATRDDAVATARASTSSPVLSNCFADDADFDAGFNFFDEDAGALGDEEEGEEEGEEDGEEEEEEEGDDDGVSDEGGRRRYHSRVWQRSVRATQHSPTNICASSPSATAHARAPTTNPPCTYVLTVFSTASLWQGQLA